MNVSKTVFVGLSGGVDSSVAALRLINQGYNVVGVFIKVWHPDFMICNWEAERLDAMRVAAHLGIPFLTCDAEEAYKDDVADFFINEYREGRTPNPDVMCNQHVKFGKFLDFAIKKGADFIATGHYVRKVDSDSKSQMYRGIDTGKDQTYFLWSLTEEQLDKVLFPVGDTDKEQIRKEAERAGLPTASKKDSQGICFLGHVDIPEFLAHYIDLVPGDVLNKEGSVIGYHQGSLVYTLGQRHGFTINKSDNNRQVLYVSGKNFENNTITVDTLKPVNQTNQEVHLKNSVLRIKIIPGDIIEAQFRYRQNPFEVKVSTVTEDKISLKPLKPVEAPAAGQSCVLYQESLCLGGGIIE